MKDQSRYYCKIENRLLSPVKADAFYLIGGSGILWSSISFPSARKGPVQGRS
jgi:hypothetical protein